MFAKKSRASACHSSPFCVFKARVGPLPNRSAGITRSIFCLGGRLGIAKALFSNE